MRVEGILRHGEDPGGFVPPNEPGKGAFAAGRPGVGRSHSQGKNRVIGCWLSVDPQALRLGEHGQPALTCCGLKLAGNWFYVNTSELAVAGGLPPEAPLVEVVTGARLGAAA